MQKIPKSKSSSQIVLPKKSLKKKSSSAHEVQETVKWGKQFIRKYRRALEALKNK